MLLMRNSFHRSTMAHAVLVICLCVFMQMLGTTMTLWDLELELDPLNASLLDGLSLPAFSSDVRPSHAVALLEQSRTSSPYFLHAHSLFRPPNPLI